ncbi:MAG: hypothetical protein ACOC7Z_00325 [Candidatus Bipolaricaulota bacterium]
MQNRYAHVGSALGEQASFDKDSNCSLGIELGIVPGHGVDDLRSTLPGTE